MKTNYKSVRWGTLKQVHVPNAVIQEGMPVLHSRALKVLLALLYTYKSIPKEGRTAYEDATFFVRQYPVPGKRPSGTSLTERTGMSRRDVSRGIRELKNKGFVSTITNLEREERTKKGRLLSQGYVLQDPRSGAVLKTGQSSSVLFSNKVSYVTIPQCVIIENSKRWSLANMSGPEIQLYLAVLWLANKCRGNEVHVSESACRKHSGLSRPTFTKALDGLEDIGLVWVSRSTDEHKKGMITIEVCDPNTAMPLPMLNGEDRDNPQNYISRTDSKRLDFNVDLSNPQSVEELVVEKLGYKGPIVLQRNGDITIQCPFHHDDNPSCSISPRKRGCFHCFGCCRDGSIFDLVKGFAKTVNSKVEFHQPDKNAIAIYDYRDAKYKLLKQVLRYPNKDNQKVFRQRRPDKGDWNWNVEDLPPMLYNHFWAQYADTVVVTEGEKDATTITDLHLRGRGHEIYGVTSGGATSWDASLAKILRMSRVVILPDNDEAGKTYGDAVEQSLKVEGIEYRRITLEGTGAKDVTEYMVSHTIDDLVRLIGVDWVRMPDGSQLWDPQVEPFIPPAGSTEFGLDYIPF